MLYSHTAGPQQGIARIEHKAPGEKIELFMIFRGSLVTTSEAPIPSKWSHTIEHEYGRIMD